MSVAPNGRIDAVWLDTRDAQPFGDSSALYYSYSIDQGTTWSVNEKLSDSFDPHVGYPNQLGEKVYSELILKTRSEIDISSQPSGIYFLKMIDQEGHLVLKKIIIE